MAKYEITYACGHTGKVNLIGHHSYRESRLVWLQSQVCFDCYQEQQFQAAYAQTEERELPPLWGSEAQVRWATSIRLRILESVEDSRFLKPASSPEEERLRLLALDALLRETSASQWITWRDFSISLIMQEITQVLLAAPTPAHVARQQEEARARAQAEACALAEATLRPPTPITETLAEITWTEAAVQVRFPEKREDFNEIVHHLGYTWNSEKKRWERRVRVERTGPARERAIELGHVLLAHHFCVCTFDQSLREAIIAGAFEPEQTRWISVLVSGEYTGWFAIQWGRWEDYYRVARRIPLSRYVKSFVVAPPSSFEEVLDFADRYAFRLTARAQDVAEQARDQRKAMLVVKKEKPVSSEPYVASTRPPVLEIPEQVGIEAEFSDEDYH
jgi:ribosomal protein L32